jgi:hypothetical protein
MSPFGSWCATACFGLSGDEIDQPLQPARTSSSDKEAMSITAIIFVLVILLFGFDSTGQAKTRQRHNYG